jgi:hypothetical protein
MPSEEDFNNPDIAKGPPAPAATKGSNHSADMSKGFNPSGGSKGFNDSTLRKLSDVSNYDESIINTYKLKKDYQIHFTHVPTDTTVAFPAFLTSFNDDYQSSWNPESVYGRNDPIFTFQQTKRTISFGFDVVAASLEEAKENLKNLRTIARMLYPTYAVDGFATTLSKAPLIRIKFANLIGRGISNSAAGLLGKMNGFSIAPVIEPGFFDPEALKLYPKVFSATVAFDVIHEQAPGAWPTATITSAAETQDTGNPTAADSQEPAPFPSSPYARNLSSTRSEDTAAVSYPAAEDDALTEEILNPSDTSSTEGEIPGDLYATSNPEADPLDVYGTSEITEADPYAVSIDPDLDPYGQSF